MRHRSATWVSRFSNTFSTITDVPSATQAAASIWACMSVGKPGWGLVCNCEKARRRSGAARATVLRPSMTRQPISRSLSQTGTKSQGRTLVSSISPPVMAAAHSSVPAAMRSGMGV